MTQFTCKGVKQINNRISFKHLYHSYLSAFFISAGVPNREFPEILIAKCRSIFYCTWFFCWGDIVREINVSRAWDPVHAGDEALTQETPAKRGRVNMYAFLKIKDLWPRTTIKYLTSSTNKKYLYCNQAMNITSQNPQVVFISHVSSSSSSLLSINASLFPEYCRIENYIHYMWSGQQPSIYN